MRKSLSVVLVLLLLSTLFLSGCKAKEASKGGAKATELTFWTFNGLHVTFYEEMVKEWNEIHPDRPIKLNSVVYPYGQMHDNLSISLMAGEGVPDLADIELSRFATYLKGKEIPLTDLTSLVESERDKFVEERLDIYSKDGAVYGLDFHVGSAVMFYNTELLDKAGVNPGDIETWSDYTEAGEKVLRATGKPMTTWETTDQYSYIPMISQQNSGYIDKNGKIILDNEKNIRALELIEKMVHESKTAVPAPGGTHHMEEYYGFMNQDGAASVLMPIWYMGRFLDYMPDLKGKIAIHPLPAWEPGGSRSAGVGGTGTVIPKQGENIELTKEFLKFSKVSKEGNKKIWTMLGFDPLRWDVWNSKEVRAKNEYTEYFVNGNEIFDILLDIKDEINPLYVSEDFPQVADAVKRTVLYSTLRKRGQTPEEILKSAAKELRENQN
jgi:arabinosaccharide transport system substrate-binding protein